jgi:hypothetical protein
MQRGAGYRHELPPPQVQRRMRAKYKRSVRDYETNATPRVRTSRSSFDGRRENTTLYPRCRFAHNPTGRRHDMPVDRQRRKFKNTERHRKVFRGHLCMQNALADRVERGLIQCRTLLSERKDQHSRATAEADKTRRLTEQLHVLREKCGYDLRLVLTRYGAPSK